MWRNKTKLIAFAFLLAWGSALHAKDNTNDYLFIDRASNAAWKIAGATNGIGPLTSSNNLPKLWFPVGEEMTYNVYWGVIHVGTSRVITDWVERGGKPLVRVRHITKSNRAIAQVYPVEDHMETVIDPVPFLPVYFRKKLSEGRYTAHQLTVFDHAAGLGQLGNFKDGHLKGFKIESDTRDLVTAMYWLRREPFVAGTTNQFRVMADEKLYDLFIKCIAEEKQKVAGYGKVSVMRIVPEAAFNGLFVRKGGGTVWVSNDDRRLCTRIDAEVPVAAIHVELDKVRGPGDDAWVKPRKD